jgi:heme/copper-type cytochrome/quinol oxidase subunit 2
MTFTSFFSILSAITGQIGPNYDPLFYDVMLYVTGIVLLIVIIVVITVVAKNRKRRTKASNKYDSSNDDKDFSSYKKRD